MMKKHFQHKKKGYTISCVTYIDVIEGTGQYTQCSVRGQFSIYEGLIFDLRSLNFALAYHDMCIVALVLSCLESKEFFFLDGLDFACKNVRAKLTQVACLPVQYPSVYSESDGHPSQDSLYKV